MRGRNITYKYKNFIYDDEISKMLLSINLTPNDEERLTRIDTHYQSLNSDRGYKYIIRDLYMLTVKEEMSTTDIANIYNVSSRTIQIWLKELGINRNKKQAQKIAVTKKDYKSIRETFKKTMFDQLVSTRLTGSLLGNFIKYTLNIILAEHLREYEVVVGINSLGIIDTETDIPVIIIKNSNIYKFIIQVNCHMTIEDINKNKAAKSAATDKGYKLLTLNTKAYFNRDEKSNLIHKEEVENEIQRISDEILIEVSK